MARTAARHDEKQRIARHLAVLVERLIADVLWLKAVLAAVDVIEAAGLVPDPDLLAAVLVDAWCAVDRVLVVARYAYVVDGVGSAARLAALAADFLSVPDLGVSLGAAETRASVCLAIEIVSVSGRYAVSLARRAAGRRRPWSRGRIWDLCGFVGDADCPNRT